MGEVFRALDTRLGREVAIKVLPEAFASDPERLLRFEREARLLASLNHPGIAHLYGFESALLEDGRAAHLLVMERAEGDDLAERLRRGRVAVDEALLFAKHIAEALEEAHAKGIVHRDLKPANVKVAPDGKVKVLDFGLAKAWVGDTVGSASAERHPRRAPLPHGEDGAVGGPHGAARGHGLGPGAPSGPAGRRRPTLTGRPRSPHRASRARAVRTERKATHAR
jgi:serine/threonine protein kinase